MLKKHVVNQYSIFILAYYYSELFSRYVVDSIDIVFTVLVLNFSVKFVEHFCHNIEMLFNIYYSFLLNLKHDAVVR